MLRTTLPWWRGRRPARRGERGYAAVEMAFLLPTLAMICFAAVDFGRLLGAYVALANGAHQAALYAAGGNPADETELRDRIASETGGVNGCTIASLTLETTTGAKAVMRKVTVTCHFDPATPIPLPGPIVIRTSAAAAERVNP